MGILLLIFPLNEAAISDVSNEVIKVQFRLHYTKQNYIKLNFLFCDPLQRRQSQGVGGGGCCLHQGHEEEMPGKGGGTPQHDIVSCGSVHMQEQTERIPE